jgi:sarcosine oxidase, subunit beta
MARSTAGAAVMAVPADSADVVIVGGGVVGASIAYHLAKRGAGAGVVLLERNTLGSGSTGAAVGGIRSQFSTPINIEMSLESVRFWRQAEDELGMPVDYTQDGYLFLAQTMAEREQFERNIELQNSFGVPSRLLEPDEAAQMIPGLNVDDVTAAAFSAEDGRGGPHEATQAFATRARERGVRILEGVEVTGMDVAGGRIQSVETSTGRITTPVVVNAAGPWAGLLAASVGVDLPVKPYRREIFVSEPFDLLPRRFPNLIDLHAGWYVWREGPGLLMSGHKDAHSSFDRHVDWAGLSSIAQFAVHRLPVLEHARFDKKAWAGLYDVSPDDHAILGTVPGLGGFFLACGFSGHGFQHSPATGRLMAELILDGRTTGIDITPLSIERFRTGHLLHEPLTAHAGTISG